MGRGPNGARPVIDLFVAQWPSLIFLPSVLGVVALLVVVTRVWDRRDAARLAEKQAREAGVRSLATKLPEPARAASARSPRGSTTGRLWGRRTRCTCSWHTVPNGMGRNGASHPLRSRLRSVASSAQVPQ